MISSHFYISFAKKTRKNPYLKSDRLVGNSNGSLSFLTKNYDIGPKHRQRFLCEVRIDGYTYVGAGNSTTKKDAQSNASRDFVGFLVREGIVNAKDVPELADSQLGGPAAGMTLGCRLI